MKGYQVLPGVKKLTKKYIFKEINTATYLKKLKEIKALHNNKK